MVFYDIVEPEAGRYIFKVKGNNFRELWAYINGKAMTMVRFGKLNIRIKGAASHDGPFACA
ncbi:MAG: hypothetical protein LBC88_09335 [Spirochaetaceae bacterium]|jgi:hypothetical protein|nr:hypothetical protein [Spirochaetaceae bacterium]